MKKEEPVLNRVLSRAKRWKIGPKDSTFDALNQEREYSRPAGRTAGVRVNTLYLQAEVLDFFRVGS